MEKLYSHSKPPTFSSKTKTNGGGANLFSSTSYDDVFGGPPKFASSSSLAPRPEDYSEIFGSFRLSSNTTRASSSSSSSSIPILDLPAVPDDIGAAFFDYSEVFGGFNAVHFALPFHQLFQHSDDSFIDVDDDDDDDDNAYDVDHDDDDGHGHGHASSDEAWTPVGTDSLSDDSDHVASSEKNRDFPSTNPHKQSESNQFNVSYHKVNPGTSTYMPSTLHVAQLNDMPGYTFVVDEATLLNEIGKEKCSTVVDEPTLLKEMGKEKCSPVVDETQEITRKTRSHASDDPSGFKAYKSDLMSGRQRGASISQMNPIFTSISDVNLRTEPSHLPPPVVGDKHGDFTDLSSGLKASAKRDFDETVDCGLPPFFDMEMDTSSFAAASAAAVEDAMEKAQAKMRTAKESRDRKDRSLNGKLDLHTDANSGENIQRPLDESLPGETRVSVSDRGPSKIKNNAKARHTKSTSQNLLNILAVDQPTSVSEKPAGIKQGKRNSLSSDNTLIDAAGQWKEATQYYEFVNSENTRSTSQTHSSNGSANTSIMHHGDDDDDLDSGGEACVAEENRRRLKATKAVSRQEYYEKMVKVALEVHDGVKCGHVVPDKKLQHMSQGNPRQQKPVLAYEPEMLEIPLCRTQEMHETPGEVVENEKAGNRSNNEFENKEESQACHHEQVDENVEDASFVNEGNFRGSCRKYEDDSSLQDTVGRGGHETRAQDSQGIKAESRIGEASKQKRNKEAREVAYKRSREASEGVVIGDRMQTACGSEGMDHTIELRRMKAADKRVKEAFENVSGTETLQAGESQENNAMRNLQRRDRYENHVDEAVDGLESKRTLENFVEQDKCKNDKRVPGQVIGRQMLNEVHDLKVGSKISEGGENYDVEKVKPKKATELEHEEQKSLQACEMDKLWCKLEEAVHGQGPKTTLKRSVELEKSEMNTEVPEQVMRMERLDEAHNLKVDNKNSEEIQGQYENKKEFEKIAELEHECELRETTKINENTDDNKGVCKSHKKFEWKDEDQGPTSASFMELPVEDNYLKSSTGTKLYEDELNKPQKNADGFKVVTAQKEHDEIGSTCSDGKNKLEEVISADVPIEKKQIESDAVQMASEDSELESRAAQASDSLDLNENNIGSASDKTEQSLEKDNNVSPLSSDPNLARDIDNQLGRKRNLAEDQVLFDQEGRVRSTPTEGIHGFNDHASREEVTNTVLPEGKERFQKTSHLPNVGKSVERKGKIINNNCFSEDKDVEKERDLEKEHLRKLEEERERLREREKDRMAVEMTIREARDRAYADARDRAERAALERATDDARQRAMTEARERLEKACAEARERSLADKEARLRAERAAVERATAEARQRAIEKAKAERSTFEARDRMQRSISEKYFSDREMIMRQSSFPASNERFESANSEPAQRCKARLERHRRTVERVAKALEEKNMRDLVAQREQAERIRLAETLDADIRRWSSGKEGNLRALLSTLQYILGPDSGWQPIPLTEVITAAAVKKAYRKATLCVHPDKLQQRGANIQQKYICEKVFDLLKEAWNRFNSEEK